MRSAEAAEFPLLSFHDTRESCQVYIGRNVRGSAGQAEACPTNSRQMSSDRLLSFALDGQSGPSGAATVKGAHCKRSVFSAPLRSRLRLGSVFHQSFAGETASAAELRSGGQAGRP